MQLLSSTFLVECALVDYGALKFSNSMLAASCVYVAMRSPDKGRWDARQLEDPTRYARAIFWSGGRSVEITKSGADGGGRRGVQEVFQR